MVDNLAEKVNKCSLNWGCPPLKDCLSIEVNGRAVGTFRFVWVSAVEGCGSHCMQTVLHRSLPNDSAQVVTTRAQPISVDSVPLQW